MPCRRAFMYAPQTHRGERQMARAALEHTTLEYRMDGPPQGPVMLLSNSLASDLSMWQPQMAPLMDAGFRVLRYDSRGHGASEAPPGPYTMEMLAGDALALLDHLGLEKASVMGCSMGGMVAQMLAARHPQRVERLVLTATACYMPQPGVWDERIAAVRAGGMASVTDSTIDRWFTTSGQARMAGDVAAVKAIVGATSAEGFCACCAAIRDMDQRESITAITAPTLVIVGELDPGTPVSAAQAIHERIAGSELVVIPQAAHFVHMECAEAFNETLVGFLSGRSAPSAG